MIRKLETNMEKNIFEKEFKALGTDIYIQIVAPEIEKERALLSFDKVENIYRSKELIFSRFNSESELFKFNNNLGVFHEASEDFVYLAKKSLDYYLKSKKNFDPRILDILKKIGYRKSFGENNFNIDVNFSSEIFKKELKEDLLIEDNNIKFLKKMDFSGIAKGYVTDKVVEFLSKEGWKNFLVDSGGDMYARGLNKKREKWGIALEGSKNEDEIIAEISNEGIATSGNTRRNWKVREKKFHHLINPRNVKEFNFNLKSVTVISENTQDADVMAKVLFIMGLENGLKFSDNNKIRSIFLKNNKDIIKLNI